MIRYSMFTRRFVVPVEKPSQDTNTETKEHFDVDANVRGHDFRRNGQVRKLSASMIDILNL